MIKEIGLRVVLASLVCGSTLYAQRSVELIPFAGSYLPMMKFGEASQQNPGFSSQSDFWQTQSIAIGLRGRVAMSTQSGFEAGFRYIPTGWREDFNVTSGNGIDVGYSLDGSLVIGDLRYTYRPARSNLYGLVGGAFMNRGGRAWGDLISNAEYNKSNASGVAGLGLRASGSSRFQIDATLEFYLYSVDKVKSASLVNGPFEAQSFQSDILLTVGFPITLSGR
jgi:hypothetical protein